MAIVVNDRDALLQAASPRVNNISLPTNVQVDSLQVAGLPSYYASAKQIVMTASSQIFQVPKTGAVQPATITVTANLRNITGTPTFSVVTGSCTFSATGNQVTINASGLTTNTAQIQASLLFNGTTYTDVITIVKVVEGTDAVTGLLNNESVTVPASPTGVVTSTDLASSGGTFYLFDGILNKTGDAAVAYSVVNPTGVTMSIAATGVYTVTAITANSGTATLRAVYTKNGSTITVDKIYTVAKATAGVAGSNAKLIYLAASSQVFQVLKSGSINPATITLTASSQNLAATPVFSVTAGTINTLGGTGQSRTVNYADMTTDSATVQVTQDGVTDTVTLVKIREGADGMVGQATYSALLTNESQTLQASAAGVVADFTPATTNVILLKGATDDSANWSLTKADSGVTSAISGKTVSVSAMSADNGYVDITATRSNPVNLLSSTEQLDIAPWASTGGFSVTSNTTISPDGSNTAETLNDTSTAGVSYLDQIITVPNDSLTRTFSLYVKQGTAAKTAIAVYITGGTTALAVDNYTEIDWATKTITSNVVGPTMVSVGNSWYRISASLANNSTGNTSFYCRIFAAGLTNLAAVTGTCYAWGAQLEVGTAPSTYSPSVAPIVRRFTLAKSKAGVAGSNAKVATLSADSQIFRITKNLIPDRSSIALTVAGQNCSGSPVFTSSPTVTLTGTGNSRSLAYTDMNVDSVTITSTWDSMVDTLTVIKVRQGADGFIGANSYVSLLSNEAQVLPADINGVVASYTGASTNVILYKGVVDDSANWSLSKSDTNVTSSISGKVVTVTAMPNGADSGYVDITATRTDPVNLILNTEHIDTWLQTGAGTATPNAVLAPNGDVSATLLNDSDTANKTYWDYVVSVPNDSIARTFSVYLKAGTALKAGISTYLLGGSSPFGGDNPTEIEWSTTIINAPNGSVQSVGNGWYRFQSTLTNNTSGNTSFYCRILAAGVTTLASATGSVYAWGAQLEVGTTATVYSPAVAPIVKRFSISKSKAGATGIRGTVNIARAITGSVWSDTEAATALSANNYGVAQSRDIVTLYNTGTNFSESRFYSGTAWIPLDAYVNGNMLVTGTVASAAIATGAIQAQHLSVGTGGMNILQNSRPANSSVYGWVNGNNNTGQTFVTATPRQLPGFGPSGINAVCQDMTGSPANNTVFEIQNDNFGKKYPVKPSQRYEISAYLSNHRTTNVYIIVFWYKADGTPSSVKSEDYSAATNFAAAQYTSALSSFPRAAGFLTSPSDAATMVFGIRATCNGSSDPYLMASMMYFGEATANQTTFSPWSDGGTTTIGPGSIVTNDLSSITANIGYITAGQIHGGSIHGGNITSYNWPLANAGANGFYLGPEGALFGNYNAGSWLQIYANGAVNSKHLNIDTNGNATFYGALSAATGTFSGNLSAAGGTFNGDISAASGTFNGTLRASIVDTAQLIDRSVSTGGTWDTYVANNTTANGYFSLYLNTPSYVILSASIPPNVTWTALDGIVGIGTYQQGGGGDSYTLTDFSIFASISPRATAYSSSNTPIVLLGAGQYWINVKLNSYGQAGGYVRASVCVVKR